MQKLSVQGAPASGVPMPMADGLIAVSVVVVNCNAGEILLDCVRAALSQARQVIVVDNASLDGSLERLEAACVGESRLEIVRSAKNRGFAAGCNIGVQHCTEQAILFLNPDCVLAPHALQSMTQTLQADPECGMVGGLLLDPDGKEQGGGRRAVPTPWRSFVRAFGLTRFARRWPRLFDDFHLHKQRLPSTPIQVEAISGALMLVRRNVLEDIGLWDEGYFLHCEDLDLCMRFRQKGWNIQFDPKAPAMHLHGVCSHARPIFVEWHKHKGMVRFYRKFFRHQYPGVLMWLVVLGVWMRFGLVALVKKFRRSASRVPAHEVTTSPAVPAENKTGCPAVGVVGATSMVGQALLPQLVEAGFLVTAYSRKPDQAAKGASTNIEWRQLEALGNDMGGSIQNWIWLAPIKALPDQLESMRRAGAKHVIAVSTTSRFTKLSSSSAGEREYVGEIAAAEDALQMWASKHQVDWTVLRPTLIYGLGMDKNINVIARFIRRFRFFPVLGAAQGLRQPIHARDVAAACKAALANPGAANRAYNISGAEKLTYRQMVERIFAAVGVRPRFLTIPLWMFAAAVAVVRVLPPFRSWSAAMAERMNQDMVFDHDDAARDLGFDPQPFRLDDSDLRT